MARPVLNGSPILFDSTVTTVTVTKTVASGEYVLLCFASYNNAPGNLTITDSAGGTNSDWTTLGQDNTDPCKSGVRARRFSSAGSVTITIGKDGGAQFSGVALGYTGVHPSVTDGATVNLSATTSPNSITPSAVTSATDTLLIGTMSTADTRYTVISAYSDTLVSNNNNATVGRQVHVQSRNAASGAQSAMSWSYGGGGSGTNLAATSVVVNLLGVGASASLTSFNVSSKTDITATLGVTSNQATGTVYFAATTTNTYPGDAAMAAGTGGGIVSAASVAAAAGANSATLTGLTASTSYYFWVVQYNGSSYSSNATTSATTNPPSPSITGSSATTATVGASLTVTGTNFGSTQGTGSVTFDGQSATVTSWSDTSVTFTVPHGTSQFGANVTVSVTGNAGYPSAPYTIAAKAPQSGWAYVTLGTPNATAANRITAVADIAAGDQLEYDTVSGQVTVTSDGTFYASSSVTSFNVQAWSSGNGWGTAGTQTLGSGSSGGTTGKVVPGILSIF